MQTYNCYFIEKGTKGIEKGLNAPNGVQNLILGESEEENTSKMRFLCAVDN